MKTFTTCALISLFTMSLSNPPSKAPIRPSPTTTPGVINPAVTQANIKTTICVPGWTKTIRPPASYTTKLKKQQMATARLPGSTKDYEEDHLISLELGGHPTDRHNLWPEPWTGPCNAHQKDRLENELHARVCRGTLTLDAAQTAIRTDWIAAYRQYVGKLPCP